jgi:hypothetical protein
LTRELIDRDRFADLFKTYEQTAFRLETRDTYNETYTPEPLRRFLAGEPVDFAYMTPWVDVVRTNASTGRLMSRVRVVSQPLTGYAKYSIHVAANSNIPAGEDIRYLDRGKADQLALPNLDYWLFDNRYVVVLGYDNTTGRSLDERELIDDPVFITQCERWRDRAWHHAVDLTDFAERHGLNVDDNFSAGA